MKDRKYSIIRNKQIIIDIVDDNFIIYDIMCNKHIINDVIQNNLILEDIWPLYSFSHDH